MITKNDCLSILIKLEDSGITTARTFIKKLLIAKEPPLEVLQFISQQRGFDISQFYEMLRKSHNQKKSPLYTNILKEQDNISEAITTLSCLLTQILLFGRKVSNTPTFYKAARAEEISRALNIYFQTGEIELCFTLLRAIKSDLIVLEYLAGRRDLETQ